MKLTSFFSTHKTTIAVAAATNVVVTLIIVGAAGGALYWKRATILQRINAPYTTPAQANQQTSPLRTDSPAATPAAPAADTGNSVESSVAHASPAVVSIVISKDVPVMEQYFENIDPSGDPNFNIQIPQYRQNGTKKQDIGGGSGFIVTQDGLIVTNKHVVADPTASYTVFTNDGKKYDATVIAKDPLLDIAILRIHARGLPSVSFGNSDTLKLGQSVIAIGNALGEFRNSISVGVISGLSRTITAGDNSGMSEQLDNVIQTDAAINPGNSGGPLLNIRGEVVGVNVAMVQGSQNIGFAIPANTVKRVVDSVEKNGKIIHAFLGIRYVPLTEAIKEKLNTPVGAGAYITKDASGNPGVDPHSPAEKAGLQENDIITAINGVALTETHSLAQVVREKNVGDVLRLTVLRDTKTLTLSVTLEAAPDSL